MMPSLASQLIDEAARALKQGELQIAGQLLARAVEAEPHDARAHHWTGVLYQRTGRSDEALASYRRALELDPRLFAALNGQGMIYFARGDYAAAQAAFERGLRLAPNNAELHTHLGLTFRARQSQTKALACFQRAVELQPDHANACINLGLMYGDLGRFDESIACFERVIQNDPSHVDALNNLGAVLEEQGCFERAVSCYERALAVDASYSNARYNRALVRLRLGQWHDAWPDYEERFHTPWCPNRDCDQPRWNGECLKGKSILVWSEQGLGDTFQFIRFARCLQQRGACVVFETQRPLANVLKGCPHIDQLIVRGDPVPDVDYQIPLMSLPGALNILPENVPAEVPYIFADDSLAAWWMNRLPDTGQIRVGIHWRGSATYRRDFHRSFPFAFAAVLAQIPGVQLVALQKHGEYSLSAQLCRAFEIATDPLELDEQRGPFMDTAAILRNLDLVITCDTSIAHLAGAMGVPVWVVLRHVACWRWMEDGEDSPWYPTMRLLRQPRRGDWDSVFRRVFRELAESADLPSSQCDEDYSRATEKVADRLYAAAVQIQRRGQIPEALETLNEVLALNPNHALALSTRGLLLHQQGHVEDATESLERAVAADPNLPEAHNNLGLVLQDQVRSEEARKSYQRALELRPDFAEAHNNLGIVLKRQNRLDEAEQHYRAALELKPDFALAHYNLGNLYQSQLRIAEAMASFEAAVRCDPEFAAAYHNLGTLHQDDRRIDQASVCFDTALRYSPHSAAARHNRALLYLLQGDFENGWREYEWRWHTPLCTPRHTDHPLWAGEELTDRTLLVHTEQGLGDTLHFVRYLRLLCRQAKHLVLECQPALVPLLRNCFPDVTIIRDGDALPPFDVQIPLLSVPRVLNTRLESIPNQVPYLRPTDAQIAQWKWVGELPGLKIGIQWQGSSAHLRNADRSIPPSLFQQISSLPGVSVVVLQKGHRLTDEQQRAGWVDLGEELDRGDGAFMDTAAVIHHLDLVVTCDTAIAHLAGALAAKVWTALSHASDWRWMLDRTNSPWYPSMRLFRQPNPGNWEAVFAQICNEVRALTIANGDVPQIADADLPAILQQAIELHRGGQLQEALARYDRILRIQPNHLDALHMYGLAAHQLGRHELALERLLQARALGDHVAAIHNHLGLVHQALDHFEDAEREFHRAIALDRNFAEAFTNLGSLHYRRGDLESARTFYHAALERRPRSIAVLFNLGLIAHHQQQSADAIEYLRRCLELVPEHHEARNCLGESLMQLGRLEEAANEFRRILQHNRESAVVWNNLGCVQKLQGRRDEAEQSIREALRLAPEYAEAHYNFGLLMADAGRVDDAVTCYRQAIALRPSFIPAHKNLAHLLQISGRTNAADAAFEAAIAIQPNVALRFAHATLLPVIYESREDIYRWRQRYTEHLDRLIDEQITFDPSGDASATTFFLAYQGFDDRALQERLAKILCPAETFDAPQWRPASKQLRVGFVSRYLRDHTIGRLFHGVIGQLSRETFWTAVLALEPGEDAITANLRSSTDAYVTLPANLAEARRIIREMRFDILCYLDIGMAPASTALALYPLAPVQCVTWGHPVTTGLPNIDYFLSSRWLESSNAQQHYSEQLVLLDSIGPYYERPPARKSTFDRTTLGLPESATVYLCPQSLFKLHPDFDEVFAGILREDPRAHIVLLDGNYSSWNELLRERLRRTVHSSVDRIRFVSRRPYEQFLQLYDAADVMLDPLHFGGGNTSYEALAAGLPIVTMPSELLRGRITAGLYAKMGWGDCVVENVQQYIERAVRLGTDRAARAAARRAILASNACLFEDAAAIRAWERFFTDVVARGM